MTEYIFGGFALLPDSETTKKIIDFRNSVPEITGPELGTVVNLPHLTLFQGMYPIETQPRDMLSRIKINAGKDFNIKFSKLSWEQGDWIFANTEHNEILINLLHKETFDFSHGYMIAPPSAKNMDQWNEIEQKAFRSFGYRYAGEAYQPHITLGTGLGISLKTQKYFQQEFNGISVFFENAVFYRAGERGVLAEIIQSINLN